MTNHECLFPEEREPNGRLILAPCLTCGTSALDAMSELKQVVTFRGRQVLAITPSDGSEDQACDAPFGMDRVCSLPEGHPGDHEVQVLAFVTLERWPQHGPAATR